MVVHHDTRKHDEALGGLDPAGAKKPASKQTPEDKFRADHLALLQAVEPIAKSKEADAKKYTYAYEDLEVVMAAVMPLLRAHNFGIYHQTTEDNTLRTVLVHITGNEIATCWPLGDFQDPQARGSEHTYARRYNIKDLLNIPTAEDEDGARASEASRSGSKPRQTNQQARQQQTQQKKEKKPSSFMIQHVTDQGEVKEEIYPRTGNGIKAMVEPFETSMDHDPQAWWANRDVLLAFYNDPAGIRGLEIFSPSMGNMTFGEWCETFNNRMGPPKGQGGSA